MTVALAGSLVMGASFDIASFGAKADGTTDNTAAIQQAIDAAAAAGGGRVVVPAADKPYVSYTLRLKSNVEFHLAEGAVLKGGPDGRRYPEFEPTALWGWNRTPRLDRRAFFYTLAATNVAITGRGVIDGSSECFKIWSAARKRFWRTDDRDLPGRCLLFVRCQDVRLENFTVRHTTGWNIWFLGCDNLVARGVTLDTDPEFPNGDGFHISSCRDVLIERCRVFSSDDCFAIRSHQELLPPELAACGSITVRDTVCSSSGASFCRFGWSTDYAVRDVLFDNVVCSNCWTGISVHLPNLDPNYLEPPRGHGLDPLPLAQCRPFELERVTFRNCRVTAEEHPLQLVIGNALKTRPVRFVRNLHIKNTEFFCSKPPEIVVWAENGVSDIVFDNVAFNIAKGAAGRIIPDDHLFFDNCGAVVFRDCRWTMGGASVAVAPPLPADCAKPPANPVLRTDPWIGAGMVFQRGKPFEVSGDGAPGDKILVRLDGQCAGIRVDARGRWCATLPPFAVGGPYALSVESATGAKLAFDEVYAGDVWICSGQSNMEMPVWGENPFYRLPDGEAVAAAAHDPQLRLFKVKRHLSAFPQSRFVEQPCWRGADAPDSVAPFSSVGYYFGCFLRQRHPDVPVGLVDSSWGGTRIEPWIPEGALAMAGFADEINALLKIRRDDLEGPAAKIDVWPDYRLPSVVFNGMVAPLKGMRATGAIWFQGCANGREADRYAGFGRLLVRAWRDWFRHPSMPFLVAQIGAFKRETPQSRLDDGFWRTMSPDDTGFSYLREAQYDYGTDPGCGIACAIDIGDHSNIHFPNKREVARRLAHEAFRVAYGEAGFAPGPSVGRAVRAGAKVIVTVKDAGRGLAVDGDGTISPRVFSLAGQDGRLVWATARLAGPDAIEVAAPEVPNPVEVRYAFTGYAGGNLVRRIGDGLPLFPFRAPVMAANEFTYAKHPRCLLTVHTQSHWRNRPVLVWFHGGDRRDIPASLTNSYIVVSANCRLYGEAKIEEIWDDAARAVAWTFEHAQEFGGSPAKIFAGGYSAGAYLACMVGCHPPLLAKYGRKNTDLRGILPLCGPVTGDFGDSRVQCGPVCANLPQFDWRSLFGYLDNDLPPMFIVCADRRRDKSCRTVGNELVCAALRQIGKRDVEFHEILGADQQQCIIPFADLAARFIDAYGRFE